MTTAAVLVTHNSSGWINETLVSVFNQETSVDRIVIVDDHSSDATLEIIRELSASRAVEVLLSSSDSSDVHTRIAANFVQGIQQAESEFVFLGDHDDIWHRQRVSSQLQTLMTHPAAALVASDGQIIDGPDAGRLRTLSDVFPVPAEFESWRSSQQFGYVLRHSVATGSACALRPAAFHELKVPDGWLHDRWWSLWAAAHGLLVVDPTVVIDYRLSDTQQVGLNTAAQNSGAASWLVHHLRKGTRTARRLIDVAPLFIASR
ncbi:MAG: glycosyltransferase [Actinomycetota bacterium]|nr:glycosyltransferase [Actinomycetota bacterium]